VTGAQSPVDEPTQSPTARPRRWRRKFALGCLLPLFLIISVPFAAYKFTEHRFNIDRVPGDLEVQRVLYEKQERWGAPLIALPGDNETGLLLYEIPAAVAGKIAAEGISFFSRPENRARRHGRQTDFASWRETPVPMTWSFKGPSISAYLDRYGFGIEIEPSIVAMIDDALGKPGSFYAFGGGGSVVIVIPAQRRVVFAYAG
jgi:hypothetical protein